MKLEATLTLAEAARCYWDVAVIGAGPSGALAACLLARRGLKVLLIERASFPRWKVCGSCFNGLALECLRHAKLSELPARLGAVPLREFRLALGGPEVRLSLPAGVSVSRSAFDAALVAEAVKAGAAFLPETQAGLFTSIGAAHYIPLQQRGLSTEAHAQVVLAACGLSGAFAVDERPKIAADSRIGVGLLVPEGPAFFAPGTIFMAYGKFGYLGVVRVEDGQLNLAAALEPYAVRTLGPGRAAKELLSQTDWPAIPGVLHGIWRGTPALTRRPRRLAGERLFLLGDAAGYVEPFTGEGIAWALVSALAVVPLVERGVYSWHPNLAGAWCSVHRRMLGRRQRACRIIAAALRRPWLVRALADGLAWLPGAAEPFLRWINTVPALSELNHEFRDPWIGDRAAVVGSSRVDLQACKLEYSIVSPK